MTDSIKNIEGQFYPRFHCGWGGCAEELFHYTSRYYAYTEAFLRNLSDDRSFIMADYSAARLSGEQRKLMAAVLSCKPESKTASTIMEIVTSVRQGKTSVSRAQIDSYQEQLDGFPKGVKLAYKRHFECPDLDIPSPFDPFLNIAERLGIPVAVKEHHVEVSLTALAKHLDSPNSHMRVNLQNAILKLHAAGYLLRNHPGLTHKEALAIGDEDAV